MKILLILLFAFPYTSQALDIEFYGPCSSRPIIEGKIQTQNKSLGAMTIDFLTKRQIAFQGNEQGLNSVLNSPIGEAAMEIISATEMKAYGWCYFVAGKAPEVLPSEFPAKNVKQVKWIYSYAHYQNGEWINQCQVAYLAPPPYLCGE